MTGIARIPSPVPLVLAAVALAGPLFGQQPSVDYAALGERAKAAFEPVDQDDLARVRGRLAERVIAAERLLRPGTPQGAAWLDYLRWEGVTKQLVPEAEPDLAAARATLRRLRSGAEGLEKPELRRVADGLEDYVGVAQFAQVDAERQTRAYEQAVDRVVRDLGDASRLGSARGSLAIEQALERLEGLGSVGVGGGLTAAVRDDFGRANLFVEVDEATLNRLVGRGVNECTPVTDCILGTRIRGTGATSGSLSVSTAPASDRARLVFHLAGSTRSRTIGVNGPVRINSLGNTRFSASKVVELSDESFRLLPAAASATTNSTTQSVQKIGGGLGQRLVERIAQRRVAEQRSRADAIAADHAEARVARQLDRQLQDEIINARRRYDDAFTKPLRRRGATPRRLVQRTTSDGLLVEAVVADGGQLAAWGAPPPRADAPMSTRLHQTAVNNLLDSFLAGATIARDSVDEPPTIDVVRPEWLKLEAEPPAPGEEFEPWSIALRDPRPVSVEFVEGSVTAIVHAAEIQAEGKSYRGWDLITTYEPQRVDGRWRLVRRGDIDVLPTRFDPASGDSLGSGDVGLRNNLVKVLNENGGRFPQAIDVDPVDLTQRRGPVRYLSLRDIRFAEGWAAAGWRAL